GHLHYAAHCGGRVPDGHIQYVFQFADLLSKDAVYYGVFRRGGAIECCAQLYWHPAVWLYRGGVYDDDRLYGAGRIADRRGDHGVPKSHGKKRTEICIQYKTDRSFG